MTFRSRILERDGVPVIENAFPLMPNFNIDVDFGSLVKLKRENRKLIAEVSLGSFQKIILSLLLFYFLPSPAPVHTLAFCFIVNWVTFARGIRKSILIASSHSFKRTVGYVKKKNGAFYDKNMFLLPCDILPESIVT